MSQQQKRDIWFEHVRRAQRAGGSLAAYARSIQVAPRVMYYWGEAVRRQGMRVATAPRAKQSVVPSFAAVRVEPVVERVPNSGSALRLELSSGTELRWPSVPNPQWLASFVRDLACEVHR